MTFIEDRLQELIGDQPISGQVADVIDYSNMPGFEVAGPPMPRARPNMEKPETVDYSRIAGFEVVEPYRGQDARVGGGSLFDKVMNGEPALGEFGKLTPDEAFQGRIEDEQAALVNVQDVLQSAEAEIPQLRDIQEGAQGDKPITENLEKHRVRLAKAREKILAGDIQEAAKEVMRIREQIKGDAPLPKFSKTRNFIDRAAVGLGQMGTATVKSAGIVGGMSPGIDEENAVTIFADEMEKGLQQAFPGDEARADDFISKLGSGTGSMMGFLLGGGLIGKGLRTVGMSARAARVTGIAGLGAAVQGEQGYEDAVAKNATAAQRYASFFLNAGLGLTEAVPIDRFFMRLNGVSRGKLGEILKTTSAQSFEEFLQEFGQNVGGDFLASTMIGYDPERQIDWAAAIENGTVGAILGGAMGAGVAVLPKAQDEEITVPSGEAVPLEASVPPISSQPPVEPVLEPEIEPATDQPDPPPAEVFDLLHIAGYTEEEIVDMDDVALEEAVREAIDQGVTISEPVAEVSLPDAESTSEGEGRNQPRIAPDSEGQRPTDAVQREDSVQRETPEGEEQPEQGDRGVVSADGVAPGTRTAPVTVESAYDTAVATEVIAEPTDDARDLTALVDDYVQNTKKSLSPIAVSQALKITPKKAVSLIAAHKGVTQTRKGKFRRVAQYQPRNARLIEFLGQEGLVDDPELRAIFDKNNPLVPGKGPLIRKNGRTLDYAREAAVEAGYLPEVTGTSELLDLLRRDHHNKDVFPETAESAVFEQDKQDAKDSAEEQRVRDDIATTFAEFGGDENDSGFIDTALTHVSAGETIEDAIERAAIQYEQNGQFDVEIARTDDVASEGELAGQEVEPSGDAPSGESIAQDGSQGISERETGAGDETETVPSPHEGEVEEGAEGKPQGVIPGAGRISEAEQAQRKADERLKPKKAQKQADEGLFSDDSQQIDLVEAARKSKPLDKINIRFEVDIAGKDETATVRMSADKALSMVNGRIKGLRQLRDCVAA